MRLFAYQTPAGPEMGVVEGDHVVPMGSVVDFYDDIDGYIARTAGKPVAIDEVTPAPPVPPTARVLCLGLNYPLHIAETASERPDHPNLFARWPSTLVPSEARTPVPPGEAGLDFEAELAVIIGKEMLAVDEADAMAGVLGYTCFNDLSSRKFQRATSQWALGKNGDNSGPIGPVVVTPDELGDPYDLKIESRCNGRAMQSSTTKHMIFSIAEIIAYVTQAMTLRPGDVITTGTPDGVGSRQDPPMFLTAGDVVEVEIEGIGVLRTHII